MEKAAKHILAAGILLAVLFLSACSIEKMDPVKLKDLEFSIVEDDKIPEELKPEIKAKEAAPFKLTFVAQNQTELYIAVGYGKQPTNGYSIKVEELFLTKNAIYVKTNLLGPSKGESVSETQTCPYIVLKTAYVDKSVVFR